MSSVVDAAKQSLQRALSRHKPTHAAFVLEDHDKTWRHLLYADYKADRSPTPQMLLDHLTDFSEAFSAMGVASCSVPNYEADDVIATIASVVASHDGDVVILSTDKIFMQLVNRCITGFDHFNERVLDMTFIESKYGLRSHQYIDYLALVGDKSNNIKGVPGIGPKSALELLSSFSDLDSVLVAKDNKLAAKVQAAAAEAIRCRQLVTLKTDVELGRNLKSFRLQENDSQDSP